MGSNIPKPIQDFEDYCLPDFLMDEVRRQKFVAPTGIQGQGWPIALSGRNLVGIAQTGNSSFTIQLY